MSRRRRRSPIWAPALALAALAALTPSATAAQRPFLPIETAAPAPPPPRALLGRQTSPPPSSACLANFFPCDPQGSAFSGACCQIGQTCSLDAAGRAACCPAGAFCTGTAPGQFTYPTGAPAVSYVPNAYFSFPYAPTAFAGPPACSAALSQCAANAAACVTQLANGAVAAGGGGGYAVTVIVPGGGGVTVRPAATVSLGSVSASAVCSSLRNVACFNLQDATCTPGSHGVFFVGSNNPAAPTAAPCMLLAGAVAAGVGLGVVGL